MSSDSEIQTAAGANKRQRFTSNVISPLTFLLDIFCLSIAVPFSIVAYDSLWGQEIDGNVHLVSAVIAAVAFLLIRQSQGVYSRPLAQLRTADTVVVVDYAVAALLSTAVVWQLGLLEKFSRGLTLLYVSICLVVLFLSRFFYQAMLLRLAKTGRIGQRAVLYGADAEMILRTCRLIERQFLPQLLLVGIVDDRDDAQNDYALPFIGGLNELIQLARMGEIDQVFITLPNLRQDRLNQILEALSEVAVDVSLIPRESVLIESDYKINFLGDIPILTLWQRPARDINQMVKRLEDLLIAITVLILVSPILLITALLIRITSEGPILFVQPRFGFNNKEIQVFKFRSMFVDQQDVFGSARTQRDDPRVTPIGRIIRKFSIDELPQVWNVLKGDMSIVGPRPHAVHMKVGDAYYFDAVRGYAARHRMKPGITGLAQVRGLRGEIQTIERAKRRVELDTHYIENWSLMLDLKIIMETVVGIGFDKNAY